MTDGEPNASLGNKSGYNEADECFCPALRFSLDANGKVNTTRSDAQEPIAGDVRVKDEASAREAKQRDVSSHQPVLEYMKLKLLAGLMGVGFDELAQRDKVRALEEVRTKARRARRIAAVVAGLALLAIVSAFFAFQQKRTAQREAERALAAEQTAKEKTAEVVRNLTRLGYTAGQSVLLIHMAVGTLADAYVGKAYKSDQATTFITTYINLTKGMKDQMKKLVDEGTLSKSDSQFVENTIDVLDLVLREANDLKDYISSGKQADAQAYDSSRKKALKEIKTLLSMKD
jgi:hypothetical protein